MSHQYPLRDPTSELAGTRRERLAPPASLAGKTVALLDIGKARGNEFLDRLELRMREKGLAPARYKKSANTRVAPLELLQRIATEAQVAVIALSD